MSSMSAAVAPMIVWRLKIMMAIKDINSRELAEMTGLAYGTITKLRTQDPSRIDVGTLNLLCMALDCTPGDLLEFVPDEN